MNLMILKTQEVICLKQSIYSLLRRDLPQSRLGKKDTRDARRLGRGKIKARGGTLGRGKKETRPLPDFVRFSGRICGSVVLAKPDDDLDGFERPFKDLSIEG